MSTPETDALDAALNDWGSTVTIRRVTPGNLLQATVLAHVRSFRLRVEDFVAGSEQGQDELIVITSPTLLQNAGWIGAIDASDLPERGDQIVVRGRTRAIEVVDPIMIGDNVVRVEMRVLG